ncbi:MAG: hypothetical protein QXI12_10710 [Candidatus Methanomethyliaceae archaeon]
MKSTLVKLFIVIGVLALAVIVVGSVNTTLADVSAQGKPPTVVLPTRVGTKPPTLTATPTKPGAQPKVASTPVAPLKATATRTATRVGVKSTLGSTTKSLSTNFTVVNFGSSDALVTATYLKPDGSVWDADNDKENFTVPANFGQKIIAQYFDSTLTAGAGSVVMSSNQSLGAVVQIQARNQTPTMGAYSSITSSNRFYIPQVLRQRNTASGLTNTQIVIQSAESTGATSVTVDFIPYPGSGFSTFQKTGISLQPGASFIYDIADETNLPVGWYGSAVATADSSKKIVVVVNIFSGTDSLMTYNGFPAENIGPTWSIPQFTSRLPNGLSMPVVVQNLSGSEIPINGIVMSCKSSAFSPPTFTLYNSTAVPANAAYAFNPVVDMSIPGNWSGACRLTTTDKNVVVFVQMRWPGINSYFAAYEAFRSNGTDTKVVVPLVSKRQPNGFATAVTIQNLDVTNPADVKLTYTPSASYVAGGGSSTPLVYYRTIQPDGNLIHNHRLNDLGDGITNMPDGWYGTLLVEPQNPSTARPIVGFVQLTNYLGALGDPWMAHNAFTLP